MDLKILDNRSQLYPPALENNKGSVYSGSLKIAVSGRYMYNLTSLITLLYKFTIPQTKFDESIQFREKVQRYVGDVMKYVDHVIKTAGPADLLR